MLKNILQDLLVHLDRTYELASIAVGVLLHDVQQLVVLARPRARFMISPVDGATDMMAAVNAFLRFHHMPLAHLGSAHPLSVKVGADRCRWFLQGGALRAAATCTLHGDEWTNPSSLPSTEMVQGGSHITGTGAPRDQPICWLSGLMERTTVELYTPYRMCMMSQLWIRDGCEQGDLFVQCLQW
eukprot:6480274-Amphidinium_carterae.1